MRWTYGVKSTRPLAAGGFQLVHGAIYDVKQDVNSDTVGVRALALGWHSAFNRRRGTGIALQVQCAIFKDLFGSY